jgi:hypothetical protein
MLTYLTIISTSQMLNHERLANGFDAPKARLVAIRHSSIETHPVGEVWVWNRLLGKTLFHSAIPLL